MLGVYKATTGYDDSPDYLIPYTDGQSLVKRGEAEFINRGKAVRLKPAASEAPETPACPERLEVEERGAA
jgi:hypothetical protein